MSPPAQRLSYDSIIFESLPPRIPFTNTRSSSLSVGPSSSLLIRAKQISSAEVIKSCPQPSLHVVIIGINTYSSDEIKPLFGAEPDARLFKSYLMNDLEVPEEQITFLLGVDATRDNIIQAIRDLVKNEDIEHGDPILIYFAGHGTELTYTDGSTFQAIIPHDYCEGSVFVIPDHVLGRLIQEIAKVKGNNIVGGHSLLLHVSIIDNRNYKTVIFDCCHAGSGTRGPKKTSVSMHTDVLVRSAILGPGAYNPEVDRDILYDGKRSSTFCTKFRLGGLNSHMFIGACGPSEDAIESKGHGRFSDAFFKLLRTISPEKLRYCDILTHMDHVPDQHPQCDGVNKDRLLFDRRVLSCRGQFHRVLQARTKGGSKPRFILEAGSAHGVTIGAKFAIYPNNGGAASGPPIATVKVVNAFTASLHIPSDVIVSSASIAVQTRTGDRVDLHLFVPPQDDFHDMYRALCTRKSRRSRNFGSTILVESSELAHLQVSWKSSEVIFTIVDNMATQHGFNHRYEVLADANLVARVLRKASNFYRKLNCTNNDPSVNGLIDVDFFELQQCGYDELGSPILVPIWPSYCQNKTIDFLVKEDVPYGIRIGNNSDHDFYVYLYFFEIGDLSIKTYLEAPTSPYYRDPQLKRKSNCTIGYGSAGVQPFSYYFQHDDHDVDIGFLKLILSTKPIDLSEVSQASPFINSRFLVPWKDSYDDFSFAPSGLSHTWHTMVIPVIQRRQRRGVNVGT